MKNIVSISGRIPVPERLIRDMQPGDKGYAGTWAIKDGVLNENFTIREKGGTRSVLITCIEPHKYAVCYE